MASAHDSRYRLKRALDGGILLLSVVALGATGNLLYSQLSSKPLPPDRLARDIAALEEDYEVGGDIELLFHLVELHRRADNLDRAEVLLRERIKGDQDPETGYLLRLELARIELERGATSASYRVATEARELKPDRAAPYNRRGDARAHDGRVVDAEREYLTAARVEPEDPESYERRARLSGASEEAHRLLEEAVRRNPQSADAHANLAKHHLDERQFPEARQHAQRAVELDPDDAALAHLLGRVLEAEAKEELDYRQALASYSRAVQLDHRNAVYHQAVARMNQKLGHRDAALTALRNAVSYDRHNEELVSLYREAAVNDGRDFALNNNDAVTALRFQVGSAEGALVERTIPVAAEDVDATEILEDARALYNNGRYRDALALFVQARKHTSEDNPLPDYYAGRSYEKLENPVQALAHYHRALERSPSFVKAHIYIAQLHYRAKRWSQAAAHYARVIEEESERDDLRYNLAVCLDKDGQKERAMIQYRRLLARDPNRWEASLQLASLLQSSNATQAAQVLEEAIERNADVADLHYTLAEIHASQNDNERAVQAYRRSISIDARVFAAHFNLAIALNQLGKPDEAATALQAARRLRPYDPIVYYELGRSEARAGDVAEAIRALDQALALEPGYADAAIELAPLHLRTGDAASATAILERAILASPSDPRLQFNAGNLYLHLDRPADARSSYGRALAANPNHTPAAMNLALLESRAENFEKSMQLYRRVLSREPRNAVAHRELGLLLWHEVGDRTGARPHLERYLDLADESAEAARVRELLRSP